MTTYQVICWFKNIKPEDRNSRNLSDGAVFSDEGEAIKFARGVIGSGGELLGDIRVHENGRAWFDSVEEYNRAGLMTSAELNAIGKRH